MAENGDSGPKKDEGLKSAPHQDDEVFRKLESGLGDGPLFGLEVPKAKRRVELYRNPLRCIYRYKTDAKGLFELFQSVAMVDGPNGNWTMKHDLRKEGEFTGRFCVTKEMSAEDTVECEAREKQFAEIIQSKKEEAEAREAKVLAAGGKPAPKQEDPPPDPFEYGPNGRRMKYMQVQLDADDRFGLEAALKYMIVVGYRADNFKPEEEFVPPDVAK